MISENIKKVHGAPMCFKTISELEAYQYAEEFEIDDIIHLLGVVSVGDGLGHARKVSLIDDTTGIRLVDGRYANIVPNSKLSDKANKAVQIIAGKGLTGGGTIGEDVNLSIVPANDSMLVTENDVQVNTVDDVNSDSRTRPASARVAKQLATEKINFTDIVNDLTTGGVNKVPSAETVKLLKQIIDGMGSGGAAQLAYQLKSAEKSRIPSYGTLNAGGSVIVASSGIIVDPNVFINGELLNPDEYTINKQDSTITLKTPVKYQAIYFVDDTYAPKYKFSVSTVNFLVNAPTLKSKLALGDVVDVQGESDAYDGGAHTRIVENTSKLNGVDLGGGLFLNEVPNSRITSIYTYIDNKLAALKNDANGTEVVYAGKQIDRKTIRIKKSFTSISMWLSHGGDSSNRVYMPTIESVPSVQTYWDLYCVYVGVVPNSQNLYLRGRSYILSNDGVLSQITNPAQVTIPETVLEFVGENDEYKEYRFSGNGYSDNTILIFGTY